MFQFGFAQWIFHDEFELINDSSSEYEDDDECETDCLFPEERLLPGVQLKHE